MSGASLKIDAVDKFYGPIDVGVHAVKRLSMQIEAGEIVALLGSSGCGKTSTLRMIAGFEAVSRGTISIAGQPVQMLPPVRRNVAMAFEGYSLYPPLTVRENIAFALKSARLAQAEVARTVDHIARLLEITDILDRYPSSISGGQQQRASLGRALVRDASLHLLDEPMGQLEPQLRAVLRGRLKHFIKERGLTAILVTHDQTEANALADRIAVMEAGELLQFDTSATIKERPANLFTGAFMGEPPMNTFPATVTPEGDGVTFTLGDGVQLHYPESELSPPVAGALRRHAKVVLGIRPHSVRRVGPEEPGAVPATVLVNQWLGDQTQIATGVAGDTMVLVAHDRVRLKPGETVHLQLRADDLHLFAADERGRALAHGRELANGGSSDG